MSGIKQLTVDFTCMFTSMYLFTFQLEEQFNLPSYYEKLQFAPLHHKCTLVWEGSGYPRNGTSMGVSTSVLAHFAMKCVLQVIVR